MIDASNIKVGGGLQVAVSVIDEIIRDHDCSQFVFVISSQVYEELRIEGSVREKLFIVDLDVSKPLGLLCSAKEISKIEKRYNVKSVFTIFGPPLWKSKSDNHYVGFANAWVVDPKNRAYSIYGNITRIKMRLKNYILGKLLFSRKKRYITETEHVRSLFCKQFKTDIEQIDVVGNCISQVFESSHSDDVFDLKKIDHFKFFTVTHNYPHKNLRVIEKVGEYLSLKGYKFTFIVTIDEREYQGMSNSFKKYTHNIGKVSLKDCKSVYLYSDALFLPTLIECFTVSYLEAFYTNRLILTSNLEFAREICGNSAFYFDPYDVNSICNTLESILKNENNASDMIGSNKTIYKEKLSFYGSNENRVRSYLRIIDGK